MSSKSPKSLTTFEDVERTLRQVEAAIHEGLHSNNLASTARACLPDLVRIHVLLKAIDMQAVETSPELISLLNNSWIWGVAHAILGASGDPQFTTLQLNRWRAQSRAASPERREVGAPIGTQGLRLSEPTLKAAGTSSRKTHAAMGKTRSSPRMSGHRNAGGSTLVGAVACSRCTEIGVTCLRNGGPPMPGQTGACSPCKIDKKHCTLAKMRRVRRPRVSQGHSIHTADAENIRLSPTTAPAPSESTIAVGLDVMNNASESQARGNQFHPVSDHDTKGIPSHVNKPELEHSTQDKPWCTLDTCAKDIASFISAAQSSLAAQTTMMSTLIDKVNQLVTLTESVHRHMESRFTSHLETTTVAVIPSTSGGLNPANRTGLSSPIELSQPLRFVQRPTADIMDNLSDISDLTPLCSSSSSSNDSQHSLDKVTHGSRDPGPSTCHYSSQAADK